MHQNTKVTAIIFSFIMAFGLTGCASTSTPSGSSANPEPEKAAVHFNAGTYTAEAEGKFAPVKVEVVLDSEKILKITVLDHNESTGVGDEAFAKISGKILDNQTLAVDTISNATLSSNALLKAVEDCIVQAGGDPEALKN
ncbi:MAG TPA: FMN-binding protein [Desulfitobacterium dehalogenans]|uniref:FMN-binding protein n=1 Tax=Desulfitobacterium dehalogenans TaxID=36854 RepID=A0A7C7DBK6_9FIRM|nr:FMN-binding protein [Desulfitobacterium dehalogenans]